MPDAPIMTPTETTILLPDPAATDALGARLSGALGPGCAVMLYGDLGAGKSALARAAILAALDAEQDVPSPTFTLMQVYETPRGDIVHADLYRLADPEEVDELGLPEIFGSSAVLVEWPERLEHYLPADRLEVHLTIAGNGRSARMVATGSNGGAMLRSALRSRDELIGDFLSGIGWGEAEAAPLAGDASNRRYLRLRLGDRPAVLMDAPVESGEDVRPFATITDMLQMRGLSAPEIIHRDVSNGFLLLEDLGDALYARLCENDPSRERPLYEAAVDLLSGLHAGPDVEAPPYDREVLLREAALLTDWWMPAAGVDVPEDLRAEYLDLMRDATQAVESDRSALVLRDYHAENLLWLPDREGDARVGLLDYQDALLGHPAYDLVSLLEDARRDLSPGLADAMIERFLASRSDLDGDAFRGAYDSLGAQRNAKIVGIFARLCRRDGKPHYVDMIPRVWRHFMRDLGAPHLSRLRDFVQRHVPEPTGEILERAKA